MAVVKAGAYGHGLEEVARALAGEDMAFFGVANVGEARRIADAGVTVPIYLLGATWQDERAEVVARGWVPCLSSLDEAVAYDRLAAAAGTRVTAHLAVDTGMGRGGFVPAALVENFAALEALEHVVIDGIGSHLPSADEDPEFTREQFVRFAQIVEQLGGPQRFRWRHLANSAGMMAYDKNVFNLVRPGLMLYGIASVESGDWPAPKNVMTLKSRVALVRELPPGHGVSYGRDYVTSRPTRVATVGIGYGDGYPRSLSGSGVEVVIRGFRYPLIGRVTMDQIMVDVTADEAISSGDEVELFGPHVRVDEVARKAGTIAWEILTGITPRVARRYHAVG